MSSGYYPDVGQLSFILRFYKDPLPRLELVENFMTSLNLFSYLFSIIAAFLLRPEVKELDKKSAKFLFS